MSDITKKILLSFFLFFLIVGIVFGIFNLGFYLAKQDRTNQAQNYRPIYVFIEREDWGNENFQTLNNSLRELSRLGPRFSITNNKTLANVWLLKRELSCSSVGVGYYIIGTREVRFDPACVHSQSNLQTVLMHEIGHAIGMSHICRESEANQRSDCSSVGNGVAVMNPQMLYENEDRFANYSTTTLQDLDFKEFDRVNILIQQLNTN